MDHTNSASPYKTPEGLGAPRSQQRAGAFSGRQAQRKAALSPAGANVHQMPGRVEAVRQGPDDLVAKVDGLLPPEQDFDAAQGQVTGVLEDGGVADKSAPEEAAGQDVDMKDFYEASRNDASSFHDQSQISNFEVL